MTKRWVKTDRQQFISGNQDGTYDVVNVVGTPATGYRLYTTHIDFSLYPEDFINSVLALRGFAYFKGQVYLAGTTNSVGTGPMAIVAEYISERPPLVPNATLTFATVADLNTYLMATLGQGIDMPESPNAGVLFNAFTGLLDDRGSDPAYGYSDGTQVNRPLPSGSTPMPPAGLNPYLDPAQFLGMPSGTSGTSSLSPSGML